MDEKMTGLFREENLLSPCRLLWPKALVWLDMSGQTCLVRHNPLHITLLTEEAQFLLVFPYVCVHTSIKKIKKKGKKRGNNKEGKKNMAAFQQLCKLKLLADFYQFYYLRTLFYFQPQKQCSVLINLPRCSAPNPSSFQSLLAVLGCHVTPWANQAQTPNLDSLL